LSPDRFVASWVVLVASVLPLACGGVASSDVVVGRGGVAAVGEPASPAEAPDRRTPEERFVAHPKALWVWYTPTLLAFDEKFDSFLEWAVRWGFTEFYLYGGEAGDLLAPVRRRDGFARMAKLIHQRGGRVEWLVGSADWAYPHEHYRALETLEEIFAYQEWAEPDARFDGVHLDVEPHGLHEWRDEQDRAWIQADTIDLFSKVRAALDASAHAHLSLAADVPYTYYTRDPQVKGSFASRLAPSFDYIVLMNYQTNGARALGQAAPLVDYLGARPTQLRLALETVEGLGRTITFGDRGREALFEVFDAHLQAFGQAPGFLGMAIHDERGARLLLGE
jgi:hypothetical protein